MGFESLKFIRRKQLAFDLYQFVKNNRKIS